MEVNPIHQVSIAATIVWLMEKAKRSTFLRSISYDTDRMNRILAVAAAILSAAGIGWAFDPASGTLTVSGLTAENVLRFLWLSLQQIVCQEIVYRTSVKPYQKRSRRPS